MDVGAPELLIILLVVLLVFGPTRLPKLARSLGEAIHQFRHGGEDDSATMRETNPSNERDDDTRGGAA